MEVYYVFSEPSQKFKTHLEFRCVNASLESYEKHSPLGQSC